MKIHNVAPGSPEWHALRARCNTASEAPVMMGASDKATRNDLLLMKTTGSEKEVSDWTRDVVFESGHDVEAKARPLAEEDVGGELYPCTVTDDDEWLLASCDGLLKTGRFGWECKQWNEAKAEDVRAGRVPEVDRWQVVQQLHITSAEQWLYMVTDGTRDKCVSVWVQLDPEDSEKLVAGWRQFDADKAEWKPREPDTSAEAEGRAPDTLPALRVEVSGKVVASNIDQYRDRALKILRNIKTDLRTDQDFADAVETAKWCRNVEQKAAAAKEAALAQTADIDAIFKTLDEIGEASRKKAITLEKGVKSQKEQRKAEVIHEARAALTAHIDRINQSLGKLRLPEIPVDFGNAGKGKRTLSSYRDAVEQALADAKLEANRIGDLMRANRETLRTEAEGFEHLFHDAQTLCQKAPEDLRSTIIARIAEQKKADEERERQRIEREQREAAARQQPAQTEAPAPAPAPAPAQQPAEPAHELAPGESPAPAAPGRPSDAAIITAVAERFGVAYDTAREWINAVQERRAA